MRYYLNPKLSKNPSVTMVVRMPKSLCVCDVAGAGRSGIHCPRKGIGMGEKVYRPILGEREHLLSSTDNPGRVRGLSRDENNQNPGIPEFEEYDTDDFRNDSDAQVDDDSAREISELLAMIAVAGGTWIFSNYVLPWWKETAWPWTKEKVRDIKARLTAKEELQPAATAESTTKEEAELSQQLDEASSLIDRSFENICFDMSEEEAEARVMNLVHHMIGMANEIRIMSNARITEACKSEKQSIEKQKDVEKFLSEKVAYGLNRLLSDERLELDSDVSAELFALTGGGIRDEGEYVPVQTDKLRKAMFEAEPNKSDADDMAQI